MRLLAFVVSDKERESTLARAFQRGLKRHGFKMSLYSTEHAARTTLKEPCVGMIGVKSAALFRKCLAEGKTIIDFDKGYLRHRMNNIGGVKNVWEYWRISINSHHPTDWIGTANCTSDRWDMLSSQYGIEVQPWRESGDNILYCGSSAKYHAFCDLPHPTEYAKEVVAEIKKHTRRRVVYRPKPSWRDAEPILGADYSYENERIGDALRYSWCMVTNGSNACYEAIVNGVPCIVLGEAIGRPISSTKLSALDKPKLASDAERLQWLHNLSWCQFTEKEMAKGLPWEVIKDRLDHGD